MHTMAYLIIASGILSLVCLLVLHVTSPEYKPSWRMVSEYALGTHKWIVTLFFIFWSLCSLLSALLLWNLVTSGWAVFGVILIFVSGFGALMGGLFDVKHKLHGTAFGLGVPTLPVGALLISYYLIRQSGWENHHTLLLAFTHATWISLVFMIISMVLLISGFKKAGVPMGPNVEPPKTLPDGVIAVNGYVNRILIVSYILWAVVIANIYLAL